MTPLRFPRRSSPQVDENTRDRIRSAVLQIGTAQYGPLADDFIRYRDEAADATVGAVVRAVGSEGEGAFEIFRQSLSGVEALELFAQRRILQSRRLSSMSPLYEAMDGFALLPGTDDVPWDSWLAGALFLARTMGGDLEILARRFAEIASEDTYARFDVALDASDRVTSLDQCRLAEVSTTYGPGMVEMMKFHDVPGRRSRAPILADPATSYHPKSNLAQLAVSLADELTTTMQVTTGPIRQDQLAATSFSILTAGSYLTVAGCLSFVADLIDGDACTVQVAEMPVGVDAAALAEAASATHDQSCVSDGSRLVLISPQPNFESDVEEPVDLSALEELARTHLEATSGQ